MIKKTKLNRKSIVKILEDYDLGEVQNFHLIKNGLMHSNHFLQTDKGKYILRVFEGRCDDEAMLEMKTLERLNRANVLVPKIYLTTCGKYFSKHGKKRVAVFQFMNGAHIDDKQATVKQIRSVAANMGAIHVALKGFKPKEIGTKSGYDAKYVKKLLRYIKKENPDFPSELKAYVLDVLKELNLSEQSELPMGMNHGDMFDDNVLFEGEKVSGVLDFDDCFYGNLLSDVGCGLAYWCIKDEIDFKKCKAFVEAYQVKRKLNSRERKYLYEQTQLFALVHVLYLMMDKKNWKKKVRPMRVIDALRKADKEKFYNTIFI